MRRSRFTEAQITAVLAEHEAGLKTKEFCRKTDQRCDVL